MKLTTKIIAGIILSVFVISLLHIIGYSFSDRKNYGYFFTENSIKIPQPLNTEININDCKVVVLEMEQSDIDGNYFYIVSDGCGLFIQPVQIGDKSNKLTIPDALNEFIFTQTNNDTLIVQIKIDELRKKIGVINKSTKKREDSRIKHAVSVTGLNLYLTVSNVNVINKLNNMQTQINNIEAESILINSTGEISIESCKANVIEPVSTQRLIVKNSSAKTLNLDLDKISGWSIDNCNIDVRNFTGSKSNHNIKFTQTENGKINWLPKNKDASLNIQLKGDTAQINFQIL